MISIWKKFKQLLNIDGPTDRQLVLSARALARTNRLLSTIEDFGDVEFSAFSQWGEDGIIDWLISSLPWIPSSFVELGVENYRESNTRLLLQLRNWRGLAIDCSYKNIRSIQRQDVSWKYQLSSRSTFVAAENINRVLTEEGFNGDTGLLSIDIDGNDYWVWEAIDCISPIIVITEYNAVLGDIFPLAIPYNPEFNRTKAHFSNLFFGASLPAFISLGRVKGYTFVGTTTSGVNAFFIRDDFASHIISSLQSIAAYPSLFRESRGLSGELTFLNGLQRSEAITDCPLLNVENLRATSLRNLGNIYSSEWYSGVRRVL